MILIVDNYGSFVYGLVQYVVETIAPRSRTESWDAVEGAPAEVRRNDEIDVRESARSTPMGLSPGPGAPDEADASVPVFVETEYPTFGVCLGHQALRSANGASIGWAPAVVHGKQSDARHDRSELCAGVPDPFEVGRYHSLAVDAETFSPALVETAWTDDDGKTVMGVRHRNRLHVGGQSHPESVLTDAGKQVTENSCSAVVRS